MNKEELELANFNNSILISKRPFFMSELYADYKREYSKYFYNYNLYCETSFGIGLKELLNTDSFLYAPEQKEFIEKFYKYNPLLDTNCITNNICHYMQSRMKEIKNTNKKESGDDNIRILKGKYLNINEDKYKKLYEIYIQYKSGKRNFSNIKNENGEEKYHTLESWCKYIRQESFKISDDICELASLAVTLCYEQYKSDNKSFCWDIFSEGILENIRYNQQEKIMFPFENENGEIDYMGKKYSLQEINLEEEYDYL
jgi:hypothetical protein